jgi:sugar/nucleoside kinase (ribokinase family)
MPEYDILVVGEINPDLILDHPLEDIRFGQVETLVEDLDLVPGSSSAIFAFGAARLGLKVAFVGIVGDDIFGQFMLRAMSERGVDIRHVIVDPAIKTGISVILNRRSDRAILTYPGAMRLLRAEQIPKSLLQNARHLHVSSYFLQTALQPGMVNLFQTAKALGLSTSLDTNWDPLKQWKGLNDILAWTDIFFPNEKEVLSMFRNLQFEESIDLLAKQVPFLAVKRGREGGVALHKDQSVSVPAIPGDIVDTVGAGDSFDAGFVYGFLMNWGLEDMLKIAVTCGSLSTRARGGTFAQPTLPEVFPFILKEKK